MRAKILMAAAAATWLFSTTASADGMVAASSELDGKERTALAAEIAAFKQSNPEAFERLRTVKGHRPEHYRKFRNPIPFVSRELKNMGPQALLPMLEALAFEAPERNGATEQEWEALKQGMIEAVGRLRDVRSSSVLQITFKKDHPFSTQVTAGEALGRLCDAGSLSLLEASLSSARRAAAIDGLGMCRKSAAAEILVGELDSAASADEAARISRALGTLSSSWAWRALGKSRAAEGLSVRRMASKALLSAYVRFGQAQTRKEIAKGITMVGHPDIRSLAASHRGRLDAEARTRLDIIIARVEKRAR